MDDEFEVKKKAEHQAQSWLNRLTTVVYALVQPAVFQQQLRSPHRPAFDGVGFQLKGLATIQRVTAQLGSLFSSNNGYLALSRC